MNQNHHAATSSLADLRHVSRTVDRPFEEAPLAAAYHLLGKALRELRRRDRAAARGFVERSTRLSSLSSAAVDPTAMMVFLWLTEALGEEWLVIAHEPRIRRLVDELGLNACEPQIRAEGSRPLADTVLDVLQIVVSQAPRDQAGTG